MKQQACDVLDSVDGRGVSVYFSLSVMVVSVLSCPLELAAMTGFFYAEYRLMIQCQSGLMPTKVFLGEGRVWLNRAIPRRSSQQPKSIGIGGPSGHRIRISSMHKPLPNLGAKRIVLAPRPIGISTVTVFQS